jgi:hypothetical protein
MGIQTTTGSVTAITIEDVNALAAKWISGGENTVLIITAPAERKE